MDGVDALAHAATPRDHRKIYRRNGSRLASFTWPAGVARLSTPSRYFEDGKSYLLQRPGKSVSLRVHKGAPSPANSAALAGWMAKSGCKAQALSVLAKLAEE